METAEGPHHGGEEPGPSANAIADKPQNLGQIYASSLGDEFADRQSEEPKTLGQITSIRDFKSMFSKQVLKSLVNKEENPVAMHKPNVQNKIQQQKLTAQTMLDRTKTLKDHKKELIDFAKLKRFKVSYNYLFILMQDSEKEKKLEKKFNALKEKDPDVANEDLDKVNEELQSQIQEITKLKE